MFKVTKLNGKYNGYGDFMYIVTIDKTPSKTYTFTSSNNKKQHWFALREWCWETWGPSKELDDWLRGKLITSNLISQNSHWAWQNDQYHARIYLASDKELNWFNLRWGNEVSVS